MNYFWAFVCRVRKISLAIVATLTCNQSHSKEISPADINRSITKQNPGIKLNIKYTRNAVFVRSKTLENQQERWREVKCFLSRRLRHISGDVASLSCPTRVCVRFFISNCPSLILTPNFLGLLWLALIQRYLQLQVALIQKFFSQVPRLVQEFFLTTTGWKRRKNTLL